MKNIKYLLFAILLIIMLAPKAKASLINISKQNSCTYELTDSTTNKKFNLTIYPYIKFGKDYQGTSDGHATAGVDNSYGTASDYLVRDTKYHISKRIGINSSGQITSCPEICYSSKGYKVTFFSKENAIDSKYKNDSNGCTLSDAPTVGKTVSAKATKATNNTKTNSGSSSTTPDTNNGFDEGTPINANCNGIFTDDAVEIIEEILNYFRILAPAVLIVMIGTDLIQAVAAGDDKLIKKATGRIFNRAIATILLFFVPTIVIILLNLPGVRDTMEEAGIVDSPLCNK